MFGLFSGNKTKTVEITLRVDYRDAEHLERITDELHNALVRIDEKEGTVFLVSEPVKTRRRVRIVG